jgi:ADP-ribosylglycohydrolase
MDLQMPTSKRFTLAQRLFAISTTLIVAMAGVAALTWVLIGQLTAHAELVGAARVSQLQRIAELELNVTRASLQLRHAILARTPEEMGVALAESLLEHGRYEPDAVWARWRTWAATARDIGINTRRSLSSPDWRNVAGDSSRSAGNGALMRSFPLAVAMFESTDAAVLDVCLHQAALTHGHPAAGWGTWIGVELTRFAIAGDDIWSELDRLLVDLPDHVHAAFATVLSPTWTPDLPAPANGTVWGCLAQAVWAVRSTTSFEDAVVAAVTLGDDADTVGCVTGAIAGAKYGVDAIPARWAAAVHGSVEGAAGAERYDAVRLRSAAERLFELDLR